MALMQLVDRATTQAGEAAAPETAAPAKAQRRKAAAA
jgi:hypothetical protein